MKKKIVVVGFVILAMLAFAACGDDKRGTVVAGEHYHLPQSTEKNDEGTETDAKSTEEITSESVTVEESELTASDSLTTDLYLIISNDMTTEHMIMEQLVSGRQYMFNYTLSTRFLDKYGDNTTVSEFEPGRIVTIGDKDENGKLKEMQISDKVWEYKNVTRYSIDEEKNIMKIADTKYFYEDDIFVVSDGNSIRLSSLTELDEVSVIGIDKRILSVSVTTGHGELQLENTALFEGSFIQIGRKIFAEITPNMKLEIPEGEYTVSVANKGYGGSTDIVIERGKEVTLNLEELKGEGPKYASIVFAVDVPGAILKIDGNVKDYNEPVEVQYGLHILTVTASGYEDYSKKLYVNSKEATILIEMSDEEASSTGGSNASGSNSGSSNSENSNGNNNTNNDTTNGTTNITPGELAGSQAGSMNGSANSTGTTNNITNGATTNNTINGTTTNNATNGATTSNTTNGTTTNNASADYLSTLSQLLSTLTGQQ